MVAVGDPQPFALDQEHRRPRSRPPPVGRRLRRGRCGTPSGRHRRPQGGGRCLARCRRYPRLGGHDGPGPWVPSIVTSTTSRRSPTRSVCPDCTKPGHVPVCRLAARRSGGNEALLPGLRPGASFYPAEPWRTLVNCQSLKFRREERCFDSGPTPDRRRRRGCRKLAGRRRSSSVVTSLFSLSRCASSATSSRRPTNGVNPVGK